MKIINVLYVDKEVKMLSPLVEIALNHGQYKIKSIDCPQEASEQLEGIDLLLVGKGNPSYYNITSQEWAPYFLPGLRDKEPHAGYRLIQMVKPRYPDLKIILFTGYDSPQDMTEAISKGADGFLGKPIKVPALIKEVKRVLNGKIVR